MIPDEKFVEALVTIGPQPKTAAQLAIEKEQDDKYVQDMLAMRAREDIAKANAELEKRTRDKQRAGRLAALEAKNENSATWQQIQAQQIEDKNLGKAIEISSRLLGETAKLSSLMARIPKHRHGELALDAFFLIVDKLKKAV